MSDAKTVAALQRNLADAEVERLRLVERVATLEFEARMLSDDDDACHRLLDKALGEGSLATMSMETLLERLPRLIAKLDASHLAAQRMATEAAAEERAKTATEIASLRMALQCARQNATFAFAALKVPSMDGVNLQKARGYLETIKADIAAELARGGK